MTASKPHPEELEPIVLEPCQFCTSLKVEIVKTHIGYRPGQKVDAWVGCRACGASGPVGADVELAAQYWNLGKPEPGETVKP